MCLILEAKYGQDPWVVWKQQQKQLKTISKQTDRKRGPAFLSLEILDEKRNEMKRY